MMPQSALLSQDEDAYSKRDLVFPKTWDRHDVEDHVRSA